MASGICIRQLLNRGSGDGTSLSMDILDFKCLYMKCSQSLIGLFDLAGNPSKRHATDVMTHGN